MLSSLGLTPQQTLALNVNERRRLLSFLLRWQAFDDIHACLDVLIPQNPTHVSLLDARARALLAERRPEEALPVMEERLKHRESLPARALLARIHLARECIAGAREIAHALIDERGDSVMAWALLGQIELAVGDTEAAKAAYRRVREIRPHGRAYLRGAFAIYRAEGDLVTASGYAARLLDSAGDGNSLPVSDVRRLRGYFQASGETTRVAELDAELARRRADELAELRGVLSLSAVHPPGLESQLPHARKARPSVATLAGSDRPVAAMPVDQLPSYDGVSVTEGERRNIMDAVDHLFGFESLLPGQLETIACVLRGEDVLTVLPTGGGKSLCYQLPAMMPALAREYAASGRRGERRDQGVTLVVSPLIALMKDQVDSLPRSVRPQATTINSTLDGDELRRRMGHVASGAYRLVYAAPERLRQPPFLHAVRRQGVERLVIDEAHCVSIWGHDFRPDYLIIGQLRGDLGDPPLLAMTATAPLRVRRDILQRLTRPGEPGDEARIVAGDVTRPNLQLEVLHARDNDEKLYQLLAFCQAERGSGIVYADTRARCEELAALLRRHGVNAAHYHAGIGDRHRVQDSFMEGRVRVIVATIAFGMGIDKPDIRFIVHFFPPSSLESYYQEAGRAGRDGLPARCLLMISAPDKGLLTRRFRQSRLAIEFLREVYAAVKDRLAGQRAGRLVMADLMRDLQADDTQLRVALSLLEEAQLVRRGPDLPRRALINLSATCKDSALPDRLFAFSRAAHLRRQQWLTLDLAEVAPKAGIALTAIEQQLLDWECAGWLMYRPVGRDLLVELHPAPADAADRVVALLERYETVQMQRVDEVAAYARTRSCRHGYLNAYLGGRPIERCDACDNCVAFSPLPNPDLPDEGMQMVTILRCVASAPWSWGRQTLVRILRGESEARNRRHALHEKALDQAEFGALAFRSTTKVKAMLEELERTGHLEPRRLEHGGVVLDLTTKGRAALEDPSVLDEPDP